MMPTRTRARAHDRQARIDQERARNYRRLYTDAVRAVEAAASHSDVDASRMVTAGASQGGGAGGGQGHGGQDGEKQFGVHGGSISTLFWCATCRRWHVSRCGSDF